MEELLGFVLADMAGGALLAMDRVRALELDAVEGDAHAPAETQEGVPDSANSAGSSSSAHVIVTGNLAHAEQRVAVGAGGLPNKRRWKSRKEGHWKKNVARAQAAASATA